MGVTATVLAPVVVLAEVVQIVSDLDLAGMSRSAAVAVVIVLVHVVVVVLVLEIGLNQGGLLMFFLVCHI